MITTLPVKTKPSGRRVHFHEDINLEREEERSRRGQLKRRIVKDIKRRFKMLSAELPDKYTKDEKRAKMEQAFQWLKDYKETIAQVFDECLSVHDFLKVVPEAGTKVTEDSWTIFRLCATDVLRAAGAAESVSMEKKLQWLNAKNLSYDNFIERTGAGESLWVLCRNNCFQSIPLYHEAVSSSEDEGNLPRLQPAVTKTIMRQHLTDDPRGHVESFLNIADTQSSETQRLDRAADCLNHRKRKAEEATLNGAADCVKHLKRNAAEAAVDGGRLEEAEIDDSSGRKTEAREDGSKHTNS